MGSRNEHSNHLILSSYQPNSFSPSFLNYLLSTYYEPETVLDPSDTRLPGVPLAMPEAESRILSSFLCGLINIAPCSRAQCSISLCGLAMLLFSHFCSRGPIAEAYSLLWTVALVAVINCFHH